MLSSNSFKSLRIISLLVVTTFNMGCDHSDDLSGGNNKREGYEQSKRYKAAEIRPGERDDNKAISIGGGFSATKKKLESLSSEELANAWESVVNYSGSLAEKQSLLDLMIWRMCEGGDPDNVIKMVLKTFGQGDQRNVLLQAIFSNSRISITKLCDARTNLQDKIERDVASRGISDAISNLDELDKLDIQVLMNLGEGWKDTLLAGLDGYVAASADKQGGILLALKNALQVARNAESISPSEGVVVAGLLQKVARDFPYEVWNVMHADRSIELDHVLLEEVARCMANIDPVRAMKNVLENGNQDGVKVVFENWLKFDSKQASQWYESNVGILSPGVKTQLAVAFSETATQKGDLDEARKWSSLIIDINQREKVEGRIWTAERKSLQKNVGKNPVGVLQTIVSGHSKYADYWIEEAMGTWISKDPAKAEEWYQSNWKSLPANKSQYVAAAYANEALKQGDAASASQWAAYIKDPKTKQRIQDGINKAAANATN